ncbi:urease accessory protein UreD [Umezakia ovalisporum]|jgi:urease accessory protein|uniref:Urease accessory protein UreD n=1 Tax=Umezakia ovalisporum FSS-43 TaxID=2740520 RepID=A0ABT6K4L6_9CYAN|nr:urease accessory protein UreD [Umezakia ovalisporum]MBI1240867.1 urease accessory protein UreD [Nostoc sp. RI_552]MDH6057312.1 urease accessory protein UreD [Umezakia ovalisporum FSS-43]MDH6068619.1 urease accessory protein UreD [Umezakia ovalisporum APH033B]MDH6069340.1 urease accessory protein UreD [Umezakia ovalisporum CobakiLakeA]MDH6073828.1 urease accessory protein UreD [Umezakia ovalisporum CS-1034]
MLVNSPIDKTWHGKLNLVYAHRLNSTQLIHSHHQAPLKIQKPFYPEGEKICHSVILHTAGGVVGGDRLSYNLHLQPHTQALITTAAASKIYRTNGLQARQNINIQIDAGACLEWLPQETILFNGAIYRQDLRVELAPGASWLGWEITRFGRTARGEKFVQGEWRSHTEIWQQGVPLWIDRQWLPGKEEVFHSPHGLAGQPIAATLTWVGTSVTEEILDKARNLWHGSGQVGATRLENGFLCRYRGSSTSEVRNWFTSVWELLRVSFLHRGNCVPRVWQV